VGIALVKVSNSPLEIAIDPDNKLMRDSNHRSQTGVKSIDILGEPFPSSIECLSIVLVGRSQKARLPLQEHQQPVQRFTLRDRARFVTANVLK
jgi:hypothetical protein